MKIRNDFVTNSSSSSFIVAFKDREEIKQYNEYLKLNFNAVEADIVMRDLLNPENKRTRKAVLNKIHKHIKEYVRFEELYKAQCVNEWHLMSQGEFEKKYPMVVARIKERVEREMSIIEAKIPKNVYFVDVEYCDNDGQYFSDIEHEIMPKFPKTVYIISHH